MQIDQIKREIYKRYPDWYEIEGFTDSKLYAIWSRICRTELKEKAAKEHDQLYHQITINEYLEGKNE